MPVPDRDTDDVAWEGVRCLQPCKLRTPVQRTVVISLGNEKKATYAVGWALAHAGQSLKLDICLDKEGLEKAFPAQSSDQHGPRPILTKPLLWEIATSLLLTSKASQGLYSCEIANRAIRGRYLEGSCYI